MSNPRYKGKGTAIQWIREHASFEGDECLIWPFSRNLGYGYFGYNGRQYRSNTFMCELVHGPRPSTMHQAAHSCGKGRDGCVNPRHLSWKTNSENQKDRRLHGTHNVWGYRGKLTAEQIEAIRALKGTFSQPKLARIFGVTHSTIQYQIYGGSYKPKRAKLSNSA